jgi:acyl carrier protein
MRQDILDKLNTQIASQILKQPGRVLGEEQKLLSSGIIDSFSLVDLALFVEEAFGVHIDDAELNAETFDTLGQLADLIEERLP